jgi:hypothetical protein
MSKAHDPYLQAAEGFLHTIRHVIDMADLDVDQTVKITNMYALVSIARSLNEIGGGAPITLAPPAGDAHVPECA